MPTTLWPFLIKIGPKRTKWTSEHIKRFFSSDLEHKLFFTIVFLSMNWTALSALTAIHSKSFLQPHLSAPAGQTMECRLFGCGYFHLSSSDTQLYVFQNLRIYPVTLSSGKNFIWMKWKCTNKSQTKSLKLKWIKLFRKCGGVTRVLHMYCNYWLTHWLAQLL